MVQQQSRSRRDYLLPAGVALFALIAFSTAAFAQTETVIWNFPAGSSPAASPHPDTATGALYGTTEGPNDGTVYSLIEKRQVWKGQRLYKFGGASDGTTPVSGLVEDSAGNLYGTTSLGGTSGLGTVFKLSPSGTSWTETILHEFSGGSDGANPESDLIMDKTTGAIYGTTNYGGAASCGTAFEMTQSGGIWSETVIYTFSGGADGCNPETRLREDSKGHLFGLTHFGGADDYGLAYVIAYSKGAWRKSSLFSFTGGAEGGIPTDLDLNSKNGVLYGVASVGGSSNNGLVFQLAEVNRSWGETIIYNFAGGSDGSTPNGLHLDLTTGTGTLYGTTYYGGPHNAGTVFQLVSSNEGWNYAQLHSFGGSNDGKHPAARATEDPNTGYLYGTTTEGGAYSGGTAWMIVP